MHIIYWFMYNHFEKYIHTCSNYLILTTGTIIIKMRLYKHMLESKHVIVIIARIIIRVIFNTNSYSTVQRVYVLILINIYLLRYLFKPTIVLNVIIKFYKTLFREIYENRIRSQQKSWCYTTNHKFFFLLWRILFFYLVLIFEFYCIIF